MTVPEKHILDIDSVELAFAERQVLSGVCLSVVTGSVTAVLGSNGCGKSCLMKILFGTLQPGFKSMRIDGVWHERFTAGEVAYLPQQHFIPGGLTAERVLRDFGLVWDELTEWFPVFEKLRLTKVGEMSGGERRILECYVILRHPAWFALLDEPFSQVEPLHVARLKELIRNESRTKGILLTDHMYRHVQQVADRLYVMVGGHSFPVRTDDDLIHYGYLSHH